MILYYLCYLFLINGLVASYMFGLQTEREVRIGLLLWNISFLYFIFYNLYIEEYSQVMFFVLTMLMSILAYINSRKVK
jgi:hypothetical protein